MIQLIQRLLCLALLATTYLQSSSIARGKETTLFVGTYTHGTDSRGIYVYRLDDATGALRPVSVAEGVENPSFLAVHPNKNVLYSTDEVDAYDGQKEGAISAWAIDADSGQLSLIIRQSAGGAGPCHLAVDPTGQYVLVANYSGGTVAVLPIDADGTLMKVATRIEHHGTSVNPSRQTAPHPHQVVLDPTSRFVLVPDLGLDQIVQYRFDGRTGSLTPNDPPFVGTAPGAGPRHLAFAPDGRHAYAINELDLTITKFDYDNERGALTPEETIAAVAEDADRSGVSGAEIAVHPNGKFLYASLRGTDEIVVYSVDPSTGELEFLERVPTGGKTPRNFAIDPSGRWLLAANQNSGTINVFRIDDNGQLTATDQHVSVPSPVCLEFLAP